MERKYFIRTYKRTLIMISSSLRVNKSARGKDERMRCLDLTITVLCVATIDVASSVALRHNYITTPPTPQALTRSNS